MTGFFPNWCVEARTDGLQRSRWSDVSAGALPGRLPVFSRRTRRLLEERQRQAVHHSTW